MKVDLGIWSKLTQAVVALLVIAVVILIGMTYVPLSAADPGTTLEIEIRGRRFPAEVVKKPFYRKPSV